MAIESVICAPLRLLAPRREEFFGLSHAALSFFERGFLNRP
jgi:hypothetical protein